MSWRTRRRLSLRWCWSLRSPLACCASCSHDSTVNRGPGYRKELSEFGGGVFAGAVQRDQVGLLAGAELRSLAPESPLRPGDPHSLSSSHPDQVCLEFGNHGQDVKEQPTDWVSRVVHLPSDVELDLPGGQLVGDVTGVG